MRTIAHAASALRRARAYIWLYSGNTDSFNTQNAAFAAELARYRVAHRYRLLRGGHNWAIWRAEAARSLLVASAHVGRKHA